MPRPTLQISDRDTFLRAAKHPSSSLVRIARFWTSLVMREGERWFERPAIRFFYEVDVNTVDGPMTWTYAEVLPLNEDGQVEGISLQAQLQAEHVDSEIMHLQSGSL